jgi:hypothetical protein
LHAASFGGVPANPEAIAWYLERSEALLSDLRERVASLRARGAQVAGFSGAVLALAGANVDSVLAGLHGGARDLAGGSLLVGLCLLVTVLRGTVLPGWISALSVKEVANYVTERFLHEPDLWRVQQRTILALVEVIERFAALEDVAARAVRKAEYFFFSGLFTVGVAFATLIVAVTF